MKNKSYIYIYGFHSAGVFTAVCSSGSAIAMELTHIEAVSCNWCVGLVNMSIANIRHKTANSEGGLT